MSRDHYLPMWFGVKRVLTSGKHVPRIRLSLLANMSMKAVVIHEYGDSSKLSYEDAPIPEPGPEEVKSGRDAAATSRFHSSLRQTKTNRCKKTLFWCGEMKTSFLIELMADQRRLLCHRFFISSSLLGTLDRSSFATKGMSAIFCSSFFPKSL